MSTTAQQVFDIAMGLIDEVDEASGKTDTADTKEYKQRTIFILTAIRGELFPYSDTYTVSEAGKRPVCLPISDFSTPIGIDDVLCQTVMPYGLAAHLLLDENPMAASFFLQRYQELVFQLGKGVPGEFEAIENIYGGIEYPEFSRW